MLEWIKERPLLTAGIVVASGIVILLVLAGGGEAGAPVPATPDNSSTVAANTALAMRQLETQAQVSIAGQASAVENNRTAAQVELAKIMREIQTASISSDREVALANVSAQADTQKLIATLSAQTSQAQINSNTAIAQMAATTQTQLATISAEAQKTLATTIANQNIEMAKVNTASQVLMLSKFTEAQVARDKISAGKEFAEDALRTSTDLYRLGGQYQAYQLQVAAGQAVNGSWNPGATSMQPTDVAAWRALGYEYNPNTGAFTKVA